MLSPKPVHRHTALLRGTQIFAALLLLIHLAHGLLRQADPDEFQSLLNATLANHGSNLYGDFWDNHGPLLTWLLQPLLAVWSGGYVLLYGVRSLMWLNTLALAGLLLCFMRTIFPGQKVAGWLAVIMLLTSPPFLAKALELRPDNPANLLATLALIFLVAGLKSGRTRFFFACGLCLGITAALTIKATIIGCGLIAFLYGYGRIINARKKCPSSNRTAIIRALTAWAAGIAAVFLPIIVILFQQGTLGVFAECYFASNLTRAFPGFTSSELTSISKHAPLWSLIALTVLLVSTWRFITRKASPLEAGLTLMSWCYLLIFALFLPTKYYQSLLPLYFPLATLTGIATQRLLTKASHERWSQPAWKIALSLSCSLAGVLLIFDLHSFNNLKNRKLPLQIEFANKATALIGRDMTVFDPAGMLFLTPRPGRYPVLVKFLRERHKAGEIDLNIPAMLQQKIGAIVLEDRTKDLRPEDMAYIQQHYTARITGPGCALLIKSSDDLPNPSKPGS